MHTVATSQTSGHYDSTIQILLRNNPLLEGPLTPSSRLPGDRGRPVGISDMGQRD
jgi:hypothetical protein